MRTKAASEPILELAAGQHGVVTLSQLESLGVPADWIRRRARGGWLRRLHRGVYALPGTLTRRSIWLAAVLACGDGAFLSHTSAAALWRISVPASGPIDVSVPTASGRKRPGIRVHRRPDTPRSDVAACEGIPASSPARTLLDLAATGVSSRALERATDEAERLRLCGEDDLRELVERNAGCPGVGPMRRLLAEHDIGSTRTRLALEERFLRLCRDHCLPQPLVNAPLLGLTVDFLWAEAKLVVETDGRGSHDTRRAFQDDRDRDSMLAAHGFMVVRFTWFDVERRAAIVASRLRKILAARAA